MYEYLYLGALPLLMGVVTVFLFIRIDNSRFQVRGIVGPYFAALALLFGLFSSLTASDVWQRIGKANTLICAEVNSLSSLLRLSETLGSNSIKIKAAISDYVNEIQQSELSGSFGAGAGRRLHPPAHLWSGDDRGRDGFFHGRGP